MIKEAAAFAEKAHKGAVRKGTKIPYITHPLDSAVIVSMMTDDEEVITAALLHDTLEDTGVTYEDLKDQFGTRVAELVAECSEDKSKGWKERKTATLEKLKAADRDVKILALSDKLSNLRNTARDYILLGEEIWQRFNVKEKEKHAWYYRAMVELLRELESFPAYQEYVGLCRIVFGQED